MPVIVGAQQQAAVDTAYSDVDSTLPPPVVDSVVEYTRPKQAHSANLDLIVAADTIPLEQRTLLTDTMNRLRKQDEYWYANQQLVKKKDEYEPGFWEKFFKLLSSDGFRVFAWIILGLLIIGAIVLYLANNKIGLFASRSKKMKDSEGMDEAAPENILAVDFDAAIAKAVAADNLRLGVRFLFLKLLQSMSKKGIIEYGVDKTNFDYIFQLHGNKLFHDFATTTRNYEYVWYGNFTVDANRFEMIKRIFDDLHDKIKSH
jgi:hypothetical protein